MKFLISFFGIVFCSFSLQAMNKATDKVIIVSANQFVVFAFSNINNPLNYMSPSYIPAFPTSIDAKIQYIDMTQSINSEWIDYFIKITHPLVILTLVGHNPHLLAIKIIQQILLRLPIPINELMMQKILPLTSDATLFSCLKKNPLLFWSRVVENRCLANRHFNFLKACYLALLPNNMLKIILSTHPHLLFDLEALSALHSKENNHYYLPIIRQNIDRLTRPKKQKLKAKLKKRLSL